MRRLPLFAVALALFIARGAAFAQSTSALPRGVQQIAAVEGVTEYRLENGLRVLLFPDPAKATTTVNIVYLVGSRHENYGETGMAHILEHLVSFGSPRHPDAKAEQASRGASRNASTSQDRTNYYETFPASDENLEWAIDLEADRMRGAFIKKEILDSQMSVVRNELERGDNHPTSILIQRLRSTAYLWHNYGKTTIGARSDIEGVPIDRLQAFYDHYYHPNNAVLILGGKFEPAQALQLVATKFGALPRAAHEIRPTYTTEPTQDGERSVVLRRVGDMQAVAIGHHLPASSHPDTGALRILMDTLGGRPNGRLFKQLVETKRAASISASVSGYREAGYSTIFASVRKEQSTDEVRDTIARALDELATNPPTTDEVSRSRAKLVRQMELAMADSQAVSFALGESMAAGDWRLLFLQRDWMRKATVEDVVRVAKTYFVRSNRTVALFIPETAPVRAEIPPPPSIESLVKDYAGDAAIAQGEAFDPSPDNIDRRTLRGTLPGGVKFALLPKQTRGNVVRAEITIRFGDAGSLRGTRMVGSLASGLLSRGTVHRTHQQIADELVRLKSRMFASSGVGSVSLNIATVRESLPELLKLAAEVLREPAFAGIEFERLQQEYLASFESQRSDPQALATLRLQRHQTSYPPEDPRFVALPDESIADVKAATVDDVKKYWQQLAGASHGEFAVVGVFDAPEIQKLGGELFDNWKSPQPYAPIFPDFAEVKPLVERIDTPDKSNAFYTAGMILPITDEHADYPALALAGYMLGGHSAARLYLRIRGKEGLSYDVRASFSAAAGERRGAFATAAITAPQNLGKVDAAFRDEITRALKEGFVVDEVDKAKNGWLESRRVSRANDGSLINLLQLQTRFGRTTQFWADLERKVAALTPEQTTEALRRYLDLEKLTYFTAGDFKKAAGTD
jgi:zinc protease